MSKISEALGLLNSMVRSGESHSAVSQQALKDAHEELSTLEDRLRNYHSDAPYEFTDTKHDLKYATGLEGVVRWVKDSKAAIAADPNGGIFDTILRCVSEGGEVFYFDPEELEKLWDQQK